MERLGDLSAQDVAEARCGAGKLAGTARRNGNPSEEVVDQRRHSTGGVAERIIVLGDLSLEADDAAIELPVAEQSERLAVGVQDVGQAREAFPLLPVRTLEASGVGAQSWGLHLDEPDECALDVDGIVGPDAFLGQAVLSAECDAENAELVGEGTDQGLERAAELVFGFSSRERELLDDLLPEGGYGLGGGHRLIIVRDPDGTAYVTGSPSTRRRWPRRAASFSTWVVRVSSRRRAVDRVRCRWRRSSGQLCGDLSPLGVA